MFSGSFGDQGSNRGDTEFIRKSIIADTINRLGAGLQPHKKSGNPVKSRLSLQIKEARDGARGPGDLGLRGPERSVDIELSSPGRARKKERYRFGIVLFSSARRGSNPRPPPWQGGAPPLSHSRISYGQVIIYYRAPEMSIKKVCIFFVNCIYN